jgi:elongation of very long chain fatty acids protein 4
VLAVLIVIACDDPAKEIRASLYVFALRCVVCSRDAAFLHVYHHISIFLLWYLGIKFFSGGEAYFGAMLNSFVHFALALLLSCSFSLALLLCSLGSTTNTPFHIAQVHFWMYIYYFLASFNYQPFWKRYLTQLQMFQFLVNIVHALNAYARDYFYPEDCAYTIKERFAGAGLCLYMISLLLLFLSFYRQSYRTKPNKD